MREIEGKLAGPVELAQFVRRCRKGAHHAGATQIFLHHPAELGQPLLQRDPGGAQGQLRLGGTPGHEGHEGEAQQAEHDIGRDQEIGADADQHGQQDQPDRGGGKEHPHAVDIEDAQHDQVTRVHAVMVGIA